MGYYRLKILILLQMLSQIVKIYCNNIVGCGGFVKTDLIGFSYHKLSAQLMFSDGTINYVTDILPNGAYSLPIYDFGYYIIKIIAPDGWNIEPANGYIININSQDSCSDDYNFFFGGFTISGKILTANINYGPPGIFINLMNNSLVISESVTTDGGNFTIQKVFPGKYSLQFKSEMSDGNTLNDTSYNLEVKNENVNIKDAFIIYGYPVFGDIKFYEDHVKDVEFFVFSSTISPEIFNYSRYKCLKFIEKFLTTDGYNPLCKTLSNIKGEFRFPLLPGGEFLIVPKFQTEVSIYDIYPSSYKFEIKSNSINLKSIFKIIGFTVFGKVATFNGNPISNAEIYIDGNLSTNINSEGKFSIKGVDKGNHEIYVLAKGYIFDKKIINFNPQNPDLGIFSPEKISICGSLVFGNLKLIEKELDELFFRRKILLINASNGNILDEVYTKLEESYKTIGLSENIICNFCFFSQPGVYIVKPIMDSSIGLLSFAPSKIKVTLDSSPVSVKFSPFRGNISGVVLCIERCNAGEFEVTLHLKEENIETIQLTQHISISNDLPNQGNFHFKDVIPGNYKIELISANSHVSLSNNRWCWSKTSVSVDIIDSNLEGIMFEQVGFSLPIHSSHDIKINYFPLNKSSTLTESISLLKGISQVCLPKSAVYEIQIKTCYKLEYNSYLIDSHDVCGSHFDFQNSLCHLKIKVIEYKVRAIIKILENILSQDVKNNVKGIIDINSNSTVKNIIWEGDIGYLDFWIKPGILANISINSFKYLIKPKTLSVQLSNDISDCLVEVGKFELESGKFINGTVSPAIEGVVVEIKQKVSSLEEEDIEHVVGICETNENGYFNFGPLNSSFKYDLKLSKIGYKIIDNVISENNYHFIAYKLAELVVEVIDNITGKAISGILLSIIGNDLRRNELTKENGQFIFLGLTPGIYYLRAMMKELEFFPKGAVEVEISEGSVEKILINAVRTSFSLHGKVTSLNGEPESGVIIEAQSIKNFIKSDNKSNCKQNIVRNEHATTDETGIFRIRGLQPGCYYKLFLKSNNKIEDNTIIRSYPKNLNIKMMDKDIYNIKIYALRDINIREISAMVLTAKEVDQTSLHLLVFPSDNPDNIITAHKFGNEGLYFQMTLPQNHKKMEYVVRLQSNLNPNVYTNISAQETTLLMGVGDIKSVYKHFEFHFCPVKKTFGESDVTMTLSSTLMLPLLILIMSLSFFKMELFESLGRKTFKMIKFCSHGTLKNSNITLPTGGATRSSILDATEITELNNVIAKSKSVPTLPLKKPLFWSRNKKS